jgi:predicted transcriptional regulator of viral defense system
MLAETLTERPSWDSLYETSASQAGLFTTSQAAEAGYSPQLLVHHLHAGNIIRLRRGIYRLVHFPVSEDEDLVAAWLWSECAGVISHDSALALHQLSDVLPAQLHITLPEAWRRRRLRVPPHVLLYHADVPPQDRTWFGPVPITQPRRTLNDCAKAGLSPELLQQAARQALRRGLVTRAEIGEVDTALAPFGGLEV